MEPQFTDIQVSVAMLKPQVKQDIFSPDATMLILTWVTFFALLAVLQKFAWKPILAALQKREQTIREAVTQADQIQKQLADVQSSREKILSEARQAAQGIVGDSRQKANDTARAIEERAKHEAQEIISAAHQEIAGERERAQVSLRRESAGIAVALASKILKENLDTDKNRKLVDSYIKEI